MPALVPRAVPVLTDRALGRALLARQMLLERRALPVGKALERLVGMQAQTPRSPYVALWSRLAGFTPPQLETLIRRRRAARVGLMRSTIHLVTAADCLALRPPLQAVLERTFQGSSPFAKRVGKGVDLAAVVAAGRALLDEQPMTTADLGKRLVERWPGRDPEALAYVIRYLVPVVQVPPRGLWSGSGLPIWATTDAWLKRPLAAAPLDELVDAMVLRYLAAFGPAGPRDAQIWSGLPQLAPVFERLRPRLRVFRDERGRELFDLPSAPRPDAGTPAPTRFLPDYDNVLLSHHDRRRIVSDENRRRFASPNGQIPGLFLIDGAVAGMWRLERTDRAAILRVTPFGRLAPADRGALLDEAGALVAFLAADAARRDVRVSGGARSR
jgi:hypothetical protein